MREVQKDIPAFVRQLLKTSEFGVWFVDPDGQTLEINHTMCQLTGQARSTLLVENVRTFISAHTNDLPTLAAEQRKEIIRPDGSKIVCLMSDSPIHDEEGALVGFVGLWQHAPAQELPSEDIAGTEPLHGLDEQIAKHAEELQRNKERLAEAHRIARIGSWSVDARNKAHLSKEAAEILGLGHSEMIVDVDTFYDVVHPDDRQRVRNETNYAILRSSHYSTRYQVEHPDGTVRHLRDSASITRDGTGNSLLLNGVVQDITDQVALEAKLRQSNKLETIGQLSSEIIHDFNNILSIIVGAADLAHQEQVHDPELTDTILRAAKRGTDLTHRLLSYIRKQPLKTIELNVGVLVDGTAQMLDRLVGASVQIEVSHSPDLWPIRAEPSQLEDLVLNLVVNARDAMAGEGLIRIDCANVSETTDTEVPQDFVQIQIIDNGIGMTEEVLRKAADPFFTTKPTGQGTGLGLSMIEAFVQEANGRWRIESTPHVGTTITIQLPRAAVPAQDGETHKDIV